MIGIQNWKGLAISARMRSKGYSSWFVCLYATSVRNQRILLCTPIKNCSSVDC